MEYLLCYRPRLCIGGGSCATARTHGRLRRPRNKIRTTPNSPFYLGTRRPTRRKMMPCVPFPSSELIFFVWCALSLGGSRSLVGGFVGDGQGRRACWCASRQWRWCVRCRLTPSAKRQGGLASGAVGGGAGFVVLQESACV